MIKPEIISNREGEVHWQSPANIALIKYWGKYPVQLPMNPSLSFVLDKSVVSIRIRYIITKDKPFRLLAFQLNGTENPVFAQRIEKYLLHLSEHFPFLKHAQVKIYSESTFPHSAGIASSAAAFSSLALCVCSMDDQVHDKHTHPGEFFQKASFMARLGSGSACRSVYEGMVVWGQATFLPGTSDMYASKLAENTLHENFRAVQDTILIADSQTKKVSSSAGHALMHAHPYRDNRKAQALTNLANITDALKKGDWELFGEITENEALSLHALMMSSNPGYLLMRPNTITMIEKIRAFRKETGVPAWFTLDAGPNIHLIYPSTEIKRVHAFVQTDLAHLCENNKWIDDRMGSGPHNMAGKSM